MPFINTKNNIDLHFNVLGEGKEVLFFLHGWAADMRVWHQQTNYFQKLYKVISLDLPGHGRSGWKDITLENIVEDIHFLLNTLEVERVNIIGSSLGGLIAIKYFGIYPKKVRRLALVGSMPKFFRSDGYPCGLTGPRIRKLREQIEKNFPDILNIFFRSLFTLKERESIRFKWLQTFQKTHGLPEQEALRKFLMILEKEDLIEVLSRIHIPVYLLGGAKDYVCSSETVHFMESKLSHSQVHFFEECGHFPFLSKPREFNRLLEEFLKSNDHLD